MAVVKYGALVTEIKGKIGGSVFQGGISGPVVGNKAHLSITNVTLGKQQRSTSSKVINQHGTLSWIATNWKNLTSLQRAAWNAGAITFPFKNKFGDFYTGSGFQLYMQMAINAWNMGLGLLTDIPAPATLAVAQPFTIMAATDPNTFSFDTTVDANTTIILYGSAIQSPGQALRPSTLKAIGLFVDGATFPFNVTNEYKAVFGTIPAHGFIWWRCMPLSQLEYRQGVPVDLAYSW